MRIIWNGIRLTLTLAMGVLALRLAGGYGAEGLALYLIMASLRQAGLVLPAARESAVIAGRAAGRGWAAPCLALAALGGAVLGPAILLPPLAILAWLLANWWSAPAMAGLLLAGRARAYNLAILARRGGEVLGLGAVLVAGGQGGEGIGLALWLSAGWAWAIGCGLRAPAPHPAPRRGSAPGAPFLLLGLSSALVVRGPVLMAAALFGATGAGDLALATVVAAYVRQAGTAILSGLDAALRRSEQRGEALLRATALQTVLMGGLALALGHWSGPVLAHVTGAPPSPGATALLPLLALGLGLRAIAETWTKALGGLGQIGLVARPLLLSALGYGGIVAGALAVLPTHGVFFAIAGLLCALQVAVIGAVLSGPVVRVFGGSAWTRAALALWGPAVAATGLGTAVPLWLAALLCAAPLGVYLRPIIASRISVRSTSAP